MVSPFCVGIPCLFCVCACVCAYVGAFCMCVWVFVLVVVIAPYLPTFVMFTTISIVSRFRVGFPCSFCVCVCMRVCLRACFVCVCISRSYCPLLTNIKAYLWCFKPHQRFPLSVWESPVRFVCVCVCVCVMFYVIKSMGIIKWFVAYVCTCMRLLVYMCIRLRSWVVSY